MAGEGKLSDVGLFKDLPDELLSRIASMSEEFSRSSGETIFQEGDEADRLHILLEGKVSIRVHLTSRPASVAVAILNQPYMTFGWSGIVSPYRYTASAMCEEDCRLIAIPGGELIAALEQYPESGFLVMRRVSEIISSRLRNSRLVLLKSL